MENPTTPKPSFTPTLTPHMTPSHMALFLTSELNDVLLFRYTLHADEQPKQKTLHEKTKVEFDTLLSSGLGK